MNKIVLISLAFVLAACASSPKAPRVSVPEGTKYYIQDFSFNLLQKRPAESYPDEASLSDLFHKQIVEGLVEAGAYSFAPTDAVSVSIIIDYQRRFAGEDTPFPSKSVTSPIVSYSLAFSRDDEGLGSIVRAGLTTSRGFVGNLKTTATMGFGNDADKELEDINRVVNAVVGELLAARSQ